MGYLIVFFISYLLGCSNMALYLSKLTKTDIRKGGSGNLGASNAMMLLGWPAGILTGAHDIGKAALAVLLGKFLFPDLPNIGAVAGIAAVLGHMFPFYLKFKGGKGFASYLGMTIALNWKFALVVLALVVVITLVTDYIVMGTLTTITVVPIYMGIAEHSLLLSLILLVGTAVIFYKHWDNFVRICNGTEVKTRKAAKGDYRAK